MELGIVTDSTADIPDSVQQQYHIEVMPNLVIIGEKSYQDGIDITREEFYTRLPQMNPMPTTGTASSGAYTGLYGKMFKEGCSHILSIHTSGKLSGIINAAHTAAQDFGDRVRVIDSEQVSMGLGWQVIAAAEAAAQGLGFADALDKLESVKKRVRLVAMIDGMEYLRRSGRVSWAISSLGSLLNIKPFIDVKEGVVHRLGEVRTRQKGVVHLLDLLKELGPLERLAILHSNTEADALDFLARIPFRPTVEPLVVNITPVIGTHVGPRALGFVGVTQ
jgi:DegV family protein with EDD domain